MRAALIRRAAMLVIATGCFGIEPAWAAPADSPPQDSIHDRVSAWGTAAAAVIALVAVLFSMWQVRKQIALQMDFERRRLEEGYLRNMLHVVHDCYAAAQALVSDWTEFNAYARKKGFEEAAIWPHKNSMRQEFHRAWDRFNHEVLATILLLRSTDGRDSQLAAKLDAVRQSADKVHDHLLDNPGTLDSYASEDEFNRHPDAVTLATLSGSVAEALADRLSKLYRPPK